MYPLPPVAETSDYLKDELSLYYKMLDIYQDIRVSLSTPQEPHIESFLGDDFSWSNYYERSFSTNWMTIHALTGFISIENSSGFLVPITSVKEIISAAVDISETSLDLEPHEFKRKYLAMIIATVNSIESLSLYGRSISSLVVEADYGGDEAMFKAARIDPTSIGCPTLSKRLQKAYIENDEIFFNNLRKSLNKKPTKLVNEYSVLRLMLHRLDSHGFIKDLTEESAYQIFCENLSLYPAEGDAARSLWKFITRWKETRRHENEFSCRGPDY